MEYNRFKGKNYKNKAKNTNFCEFFTIWILLIFLFILLGFAISGMINYWKETIQGGSLANLLEVMFLTILSSAFLFLTFIVSVLTIDHIKDTYWLINDMILIFQTREIREKLFINKLPTGVDLAKFFKKKEIDLVEMKDMDLMKNVYLKGKYDGVY